MEKNLESWYKQALTKKTLRPKGLVANLSENESEFAHNSVSNAIGYSVVLLVGVVLSGHFSGIPCRKESKRRRKRGFGEQTPAQIAAAINHEVLTKGRDRISGGSDGRGQTVGSMKIVRTLTNSGNTEI